jgi:hypothetical protein
MVTGVVPVLLAVTLMLPVALVPVWKLRFVMLTCSVAVNVNVRAPIHAATAMLTATVTAMSMIDATTGLRAFLLLLFIFLFIPPFGTGKYAREVGDLNLTTHYTIFVICKTPIHTPAKGALALRLKEHWEMKCATAVRSYA